MRKAGATLKIHTDQLFPFTGKIELDGQDITHYCQGVEVRFDAEDVTKATLKILVEKLDVNAEALLLLQAHVEAAETK